jgi:hypothetical protein
MPQRSDLAMFSTDLLFRLVIASPPPHHPILHRDCRVYWPMYHAFQLPGVDCALGERIGPCQEPYGQFICTSPSRLMGPRIRCLLRLGRSCNARQACPAPAGRNACVACIAANTHRPIGVTTESSQIFGTREYIKQQRPRPLQRVVLHHPQAVGRRVPDCQSTVGAARLLCPIALPRPQTILLLHSPSFFLRFPVRLPSSPSTPPLHSGIPCSSGWESSA